MTKLRFSFFRYTTAGVALVAVAASAQEKRPMTIVELIDVPQVGSPRLSPDGTE